MKKFHLPSFVWGVLGGATMTYLAVAVVEHVLFRTLETMP